MADKQTPARRPAARDFKDAGTGRAFTKGDAIPDDVDDGEYANYLAAGLIEPAADEKPSVEKPATKSTGKAD